MWPSSGFEQSTTPVPVTRTAVETRLDKYFPTHIGVLTGIYVKHAAHSARAAFTVPELDVNNGQKLIGSESSTMVKVIVVTRALTFQLSTPPQHHHVIPYDSSCAINRFMRSSLTDIITTVVRRELEQFKDR